MQNEENENDELIEKMKEKRDNKRERKNKLHHGFKHKQVSFET